MSRLRKISAAFIALAVVFGLFAFIEPTAGGATSDGWQQQEGAWYYYEGGSAKTGWLKNGGVWYYLKSSGAMASSEWVKDGGVRYYLKPSGAMASSEWVKDGGVWYYLKSSGAMASSEWIKDGGVWYWLKLSGAMASGETLKIDGVSYTFSASGAWQDGGTVMYSSYDDGLRRGAATLYPYSPGMTGWARDKHAIWRYYINGEVQTGWLQWNGNWYYLYPNPGSEMNGSMVCSGTIILSDGSYTFDNDGRLIGPKDDPRPYYGIWNHGPLVAR